MEKLGTSGAVLNLANDYSVYRFLNGEINFTDIPRIIESSMKHHDWSEHPSMEHLKKLDSWFFHEFEKYWDSVEKIFSFY